MQYNLICEWFKTTILGIILLGAMGSVIAVLLIKLITWLWRKSATNLAIRSLTPLMRNMLVSKIVSDQLLQNAPHKAQCYFVSLAIKSSIAYLLLIATTAVAAIYIIVRGPVFTWGLFTVMVFCFLALYRWLYEALSYNVSQEVLFNNQVEDFEESLKKNSVQELLMMVKDIDKRNEEHEYE